MSREGMRALALRARRIARRETSRRTEERGPFDVIGDVHGCLETLRALLAALGFVRAARWGHRHPSGRRALFLGDYVNRGPASGGVLSTVHAMVADGQALAIAGNHEEGLLWTLERSGLEPAPDGARLQGESGIWHLKGEVWAWLATLPGHLVVDAGALVVGGCLVAARWWRWEVDTVASSGYQWSSLLAGTTDGVLRLQDHDWAVSGASGAPTSPRPVCRDTSRRRCADAAQDPGDAQHRA